MAVAANNAFLLLLVLFAAIVVFNTILAVTHEADLARGTGLKPMIPSREEAHVHLRQKKNKLPDEEPIDEEVKHEEAEQHPEEQERGDKAAEDTGDKQQEDNTAREQSEEGKEEIQQEEGDQSGAGHKIAGLSCAAYGGPSDEDASEMVYWEDIPTDAAYVSPFKAVGPENKYLTFEPDQGLCWYPSSTLMRTS